MEANYALYIKIFYSIYLVDLDQTANRCSVHWHLLRMRTHKNDGIGKHDQYQDI